MDSIIVFDMDGVLTEVSESYREAIVQTVARLTGHQITRDLIQQYKNQGGWNNDWALSQKIAADLGVHVDYSDVVDQFNKIFLGSNGDGLIQRERWFPQPGLLERLMERFGIAIFTGRLRYEADISLRRFGAALRFDPIICTDDVANGKPAPDGLLAIQERKPGRKLIYVGDTVDDARASRAAGVPFIGIAAESHSRRQELIRLFQQERAIAILENINQIEEAL
ncbi:MAG: HAD family hydrolase [Acidobacteria bacterium]|nr:MAG: HAD family hydrolase [Acidobacteriota bacterium]